MVCPTSWGRTQRGLWKNFQGAVCVEHWEGDAVKDEVGRLAGADHSGPESPAKEFGSLSKYPRNLDKPGSGGKGRMIKFI